MLNHPLVMYLTQRDESYLAFQVSKMLVENYIQPKFVSRGYCFKLNAVGLISLFAKSLRNNPSKFIIFNYSSCASFKKTFLSHLPLPKARYSKILL